jgi:hypothetical protein
MNRKWRVISIVCWLFIIGVEVYAMATKEGATPLGIFTLAAASLAILVTVVVPHEGEKNH